MATHAHDGHPDALEVTVPVATVWTRPDAPRDVDAPATAAEPDVSAWTGAMDAAVRKDLNGRTLTQLLMGEAVRVLERSGDWVRVAALGQASSAHPTGYPGWMRCEHLGSPVQRTTGPTAVVMTRTAVCELEDGSKTELSFGTALWVASVDEETAAVLLPGGRVGSVPLDHLRLAHERQQPAFGADDVLGTAAQFLGLRYLWGGTSAWGLDCSGLVHLVFRAFGVALPRDAFDQAAHVDPVPLDDVRPGDLYFFARPGQRVYHVGFASRPFDGEGRRWMLHAPETGEFIEDAPMAPHRLDTLVTAGRVRKPDAGRAAR
ncbi:MAG TPA: C40 family peptidase [Nocardioidaceae bacterium]|nr:C40 family peptidase [Nocardioidaceae bacterium]